MYSQLLILSLASLFSGSSAFTCNLWVSPGCAGEPVGAGTISLSDGCNTAGVGVAEGVTVSRDDSDGANDSVVLYTTDDCSIDNVLAQNDGGCIEIDSSIGEYKSFNVISGSYRKGRSRAWMIAPTGKKRLPRKTTGYETDEQGTLLIGTDAPSWHEAVQNSPYSHGMVSEYDGKMWKWHQVAKGKWSGIDPLHWDDAVHVRNDTLIPWNGHTENLQQAPKSSLDRRDSCSYMSICSAKIGSTSASFAYNAVANYYSQIASLKADPQGYVWNALNTPFVQTVVVVIDSRTIPGHATSETHEVIDDETNQLLSQCRSQNDQIGTLIYLQQTALELQKQNEEQIASVLSVLSDQQGRTHTASFQATEDGQNSESVGACSNGATPNSKMDEEAQIS